MQRWEHKFVRADMVYNVWKPRIVDQEELPQWDSPSNVDMYTYIDQMGDHGWELVTYCPYLETSIGLMKAVNINISAIQLIFKRPKQE